MDQIVPWFLEQGLLGIIIVVEGFALCYLYNELKKTQQGRIEDLKTHAADLREIQADRLKWLGELSEMLKLILTVANRSG